MNSGSFFFAEISADDVFAQPARNRVRLDIGDEAVGILFIDQ